MVFLMINGIMKFLKKEKLLKKDDIAARMNELARLNIPFLFVINYDRTLAYIEPLDSIDPNTIMYQFGQEGNIPDHSYLQEHKLEWDFLRPDRKQYHDSFNTVVSNEKAGNSYLANLTCKIPIHTNFTLKEIFLRSSARYRLWIKDTLVCFSPEIFIQVKGNEISSFPMKGTINATLPDAQNLLINNAKEAAEHATIVDLIRNDLSMVANHVHVPRYRYVERLETNHGAILQTSSEIRGNILPYYHQHPGDMLMKQLPAGSITGAPKPKTMEIIHEAENYDRGFYTGVMGIWKDGDIDSAVMIRFIDQENNKLYYKAGGGITAQSDEESEYNEIIEKIYVPIC